MSALSRRSVLAATLAPALPAVTLAAADPIFAAIDAARSADALHTGMLNALRDDDSEEADRACDEAARASALAVRQLGAIRPTTHAGLVALVAFYVEDADGTDIGARHLASLLAVLKPPLPS